MKYLGLDVGTKRTGVAFADTDDDILFSLETIEHSSEEDLLKSIQNLISEKQIDELVLGLPLLPSGEEGSQAEVVHSLCRALDSAQIPYSLVDERYTTEKSKELDSDAAAACKILQGKLG